MFQNAQLFILPPLPARRRTRSSITKIESMKKKLKHIIERLAELKDFVFADPLLLCETMREATAHCTHLQIAQAYAQTKICKRVQFLPTQYYPLT